MGVMLIAGQLLSLFAKVAVAAFLLKAYLHSGRRSPIYLAIAWLVSAVVVLMDTLDMETLVAVFYALFSAVLFYGSLLFLIEEGQVSLKRPWIWALPPIVGTIYSLLLGSGWESRVGVSYGISAFYVFLAGVTIASAEADFPTARRAGIALALFGLHEMDYPVLRDVQWFAPIGFALGAFLTVLSAYLMAKMVLSERFIGSKPAVEVKPGVRLLTRRDYERVVTHLKDYPVLAFLREPNTFPAWTGYMLTAVTGDMRIHPTNLARMSEIVSRYLREASAQDVTGVVVIDGVEFLVTYNGLQPVLKFLATLRDMALVNRALLLVFIEEGAWNPKELSMLKRIFAGE
ncbi:DUF835 domain-containing protein [Thermococcus henrietii]|uniref:DUF835 domain-containing protein n=1 Tax=Thermococcus henrietii TaxID=2016361 RepID=UPI000C07731C|nr:DUF835 domain-containing protein [Thermococcus henrietii]